MLPSNLWYKAYLGNKIVDHSGIVGDSPIGAASTTLGKDNSKTTLETFKFWHLVRLILDVWRQRYYTTHRRDLDSIQV